MKCTKIVINTAENLPKTKKTLTLSEQTNYSLCPLRVQLLAHLCFTTDIFLHSMSNYSIVAQF